MNQRVESAMRKMVTEFENPDEALLRAGDTGEVGKLWKDLHLWLELSASELTCKDDRLRPEILSVINEGKKVSLQSIPCVRALLRESASGKITRNHAEMIECAIGASAKIKELIEEACDSVSPELLVLYKARLN